MLTAGLICSDHVVFSRSGSVGRDGWQGSQCPDAGPEWGDLRLADQGGRSYPFCPEFIKEKGE